MKTKKMIRITIIVILIGFILTTLTSVNFLSKVIADNSKDVNTLLAARIYDTIKSDLYEPIMAGRTMSNDSFLKKALKQEEKIPEDEMVSEMSEYLSTIRDNLEYSTAFVISDKTKKYYACEGLNRIVSPEDDAYDSWYNLFIQSGKQYNYNVDKDKVNNDQWTIFVNTRIEDENGEVLGICGVGIIVTDIQKIIYKFEQEYNVKINLADKDGVVQVDTDSVNIAQAVIDDIASKPVSTDEYFYEKGKRGSYVVTKYMEDFGWYLVIRNESYDNAQIFSNLIVKNIIVLAIILILLLISVRMILDSEKKKLEKSAITDSLTGLANRNYFDYRVEENLVLFMQMYRSVAIFDIDKFKNINDTMGHLKGDEILKQVAHLAKETVGEKGQIIRWGGDEFLILFYQEAEEGYQTCEELRKVIEEKTISTISMGVCRLQDDIESSFHKADEYLYKSKNQGRNRVTVCLE